MNHADLRTPLPNTFPERCDRWLARHPCVRAFLAGVIVGAGMLACAWLMWRM
jgi:hypothetical protein